MKLAFCQTNIAFEDKEKNITTALKLISSAASKGVDLILFPEMSFTGFSMNVALTGENSGYTVNKITAAAKKYGIAIGFGYVLLNGGKGENHYTVIDSNGEIKSDYIKIHSFAIGGERDDFISGNKLPLPFEISSHKTATFICYDLRFPEIFRAVADSASIITVAANWPSSRREHWIALLRARAIENQVYIVGINCTGNQDGLLYCGDSMVIDPWGNMVAAARSADEEMVICDIADDVDKIRTDFPVQKSRKIDLYSSIYNNLSK